MKRGNTNLLDEKALSIPIFSSCSRRLTKSDALIANYIADNFQRIMQMTISELSQETNTSEITVSRFCKKLDLPGFQSLKVLLASQNHQHSGDLEVNPEDDIDTIVSKIFQNIQEGLNITRKLLDYEALEQAAQLVAHASRLLVYGYGTSGTICKDIGTRFLRFGIPVEALSDPHLQATIAATCSKKFNTVMIIVSLSGSSIDLVQSARLARELGAKIILITSHKRSPLAVLADVILIGMGPEIKLLAEATVTRLTYLAIVDVLYTKVAILKGTAYHNNITNMRKALAPFKS